MDADARAVARTFRREREHSSWRLKTCADVLATSKLSLNIQRHELRHGTSVGAFRYTGQSVDEELSWPNWGT